MGQCHSTRKRIERSARGKSLIRLKHRPELKQEQSATSVIIPEVTEHVNQSFSSDDEVDEIGVSELLKPLSSSTFALTDNKNDSSGSAGITYGIANIYSPYNEHHPSSGSLDALPVSAKNKRNQHHLTYNDYNQSKTSLITIEREREKIYSITSSHPQTKESIVFDTPSSEEDDVTTSRSPAVLRRLIAQTKYGLRHTGRLEQLQQPSSLVLSCNGNNHEPLAVPAFSGVHQSLSKTIISEVPSDEESEIVVTDDNINNITNDSIPFDFRTLSKHTSTIIHDSSSITGGRISKVNHRLEKIGPLSPVKLKTSNCVSPQSIRIYEDNDIPKIYSTAVDNSSIKHTAKKLIEAKKNGEGSLNLAGGDELEKAIDHRTMQNFYKLQLQLQVAKKHETKQKMIVKMDDRIKDVHHHRQLWEVYQSIQDNVTSTAQANEQQQAGGNKEEIASNPNVVTSVIGGEAAKTFVPSSVEDLSPIPNIITDMVESTNADENINDLPRRQQRRRNTRRRFLRKHLSAGNVMEHETSATPNEIIHSNEMSRNNTQHQAVQVEFDLEDIPITSEKNGSKSPHTKGRTRAIRQRNSPIQREKADEIERNCTIDENLLVETTRKPIERSNSIDLQQTETWFFNFQEEFENTNTADHLPKLKIDGDESCSNSQAELSLLSERSMEIQRRLYAEKRRQRKKLLNMKQSTAETPPIRNGNKQSVCNSINSTSSYCSGSSYDYGPSNKARRPPLSTDGRSIQNSLFGGGSAQEIYYAPTQEEKIRIAKDVLRSRNVNNIEMVIPTSISTPKANTLKSIDNNVDGIDNCSIVSDLDDSCTSNRSYHSNLALHDYGPQRRSTRRNRWNNNADGEEDQSSIASDVSFDLSHKVEHQAEYNTASIVNNHKDSLNCRIGMFDESTNCKTTGTLQKSTYDFQSVIQRRLDIENRLRELMSSDSTDLSQTCNNKERSFGQCNEESQTINNEIPTLQHLKLVQRDEKSAQCTKFDIKLKEYSSDVTVTPIDLSKSRGYTERIETDLVASDEIAVITPNSSDCRDESLGNRIHTATLTKNDLPTTSAVKGRSDFRRLLDAVVVDTDRCPSTDDFHKKNVSDQQFWLPVTKLSVINESYESSESPVNRARFHQLHDSSSTDIDTSRLDATTTETLLLADRVEARVNDILKSYSDDVLPSVTRPTLYGEKMQSNSTTTATVHVIEDSP